MNYYSVINIPTESILETYFSKESLNLLKSVRFETKSIDKERFKDMFYLDEVYQRTEDKELKEYITRLAVLTINEI